MRLKELNVIEDEFINEGRYKSMFDTHGYSKFERKIYKVKRKFNLDIFYIKEEITFKYGKCELRDDEPRDLIYSKFDNEIQCYLIENILGEKYTVEKFEEESK